ncbi:ABC transporter permease subunit [Miltoncostaea oceani]|uniref:ABC transporter permease subunit n=1 Tax=Miltoncostaea oceani TaxID=2843216 RepID=UPI001C3E5FCF|nr:ABC transporter permease subunit [Miltoncostaea oceani]
MSPASRDAEIRDVRYQRYDGQRRGRGAAVMSLARWGALRSLGARRGWKAKAIPITLILLAVAPAVIVLGVRALFAEQSGIDLSDALPFSGYQAIIGIVILLFAAITTPELLCPDRRDGTLSLYFSTAVSRREYLAGRVLAAILPLLLVTLVPLLVLFAGIMVFEEFPLAWFWDNWDELPRILAAGLINAFYYGLVGLAVSSLTARRAFAVGGYLLLLVAPTVVGGLLGEVFPDSEAVELMNLSVLPISFAGEIFPDARDDIPNDLWQWALIYAIVVGAAVLVLLRRYRAGTDG